jgi:hypothetical protein
LLSAISRAATMFIIMQLVCPRCLPESVGSTQPVADQSLRSRISYSNSSSEAITAVSPCSEGVAAVSRLTSHSRCR